MRDIVKISLRLFVITAIAGLALGFTDDATNTPIAEQAEIAAMQARKSVLPDAEEFTEITELPKDIDSAFSGAANGETVGYTAQVTVKGYGGNIEVMVGMSLDGKITGVNVGGSDFAETAGLGARAKEPWFSEQYTGLTPQITLGEDVDAITAATRTSKAVTDGVNLAADYILKLIENGGAAHE